MKHVLTAIAAVAAIASAAHAETATIRVTAHVPVICRAEFLPVPAQQNGTIQLGVIKEFCNDGLGYQLIASYSAGSGLGEFVVDGQPVALDPAGRTVLTRMSGPQSSIQTLSYRPGDSSITNLSIEIRAASI